MKSASEMRAEVVERAQADPQWRRRLLDDPKAAVGEALGVAIPGSMDVRVHEEDEHTAHIVLPPPGRLDPADLAHAAGGFSSAPESMNVLNW